MNHSSDTVEVPDKAMANFVLTNGLETSDENWHDNTSDELHGNPFEWEYPRSVDDCKSWDIEVVSKTEDETEYHGIRVMAVIEGEVTRLVSRAKYNPPGKAHPAEYETETHPVAVDVTLWFSGLGQPEVHVDHY
jgi:hypothetical protein